MADKGSTPEGAPAETPAGGGSGGIKPYIPLLANLIAMPVLAYLLVVFVLVPKLQNAAGGEAKSEVKQEASAKSEGKSEKSGKEEKKGEKGEAGKATKYAAALSKKVIVNVAKSQGTRYLLADITIVSADSGIEDIVKSHDAELRSAAIGVMYTKTLTDLEQPQAMAQIRSELLSVFSNILGGTVVKEIYLTEFAIQ